MAVRPRHSSVLKALFRLESHMDAFKSQNESGTKPSWDIPDFLRSYELFLPVPS